MGKYDDIINLERPKSNYPKMDLIKRSSQFAPFSALTGYDDEINEVGRLVSKKQELTEDMEEQISQNLNIIKRHISEKPKVKITYFIKDQHKDGGVYKTIICTIKKIDEIKKEILLFDNLIIKLENIKEISLDYNGSML